MKKFNIILTITAFGLLSITACHKAGPTVEDEAAPRGMVVVSVNPDNGSPASTKADGAAVETAKAESAIRSLQVFVFYDQNNPALGQVAGNKETDRYATFTGELNTQSMTLTTTTGLKRIYAIANAPRLSNVISESDLKSRVIYLGNNYLTSTTVGAENRLGLVMAGAYGYSSGDNPINVTATAKEITAYTQNQDASITSVAIPLYRLAARIELQNVKVDFTNTWLEGCSFTLEEVYLKNVPNGVYTTGQNGALLSSDSGYWTNKITRESTPVDKASLNVASLVYELRPSGGTACNTAGAETAINSYFYSFPNPITSDQTSSAWSQRRTRLVIKGKISGTGTAGADFGAGTSYFYPVSIAVPDNFVESGSSTPASSATHAQIVGNHKYVINKITITSLGKPSDDNDEVPVSGRAKVDVQVQDWNGNTVLNYEF